MEKLYIFFFLHPISLKLQRIQKTMTKMFSEIQSVIFYNFQRKSLQYSFEKKNHIRNINTIKYVDILHSQFPQVSSSINSDSLGNLFGFICSGSPFNYFLTFSLGIISYKFHSRIFCWFF